MREYNGFRRDKPTFSQTAAALADRVADVVAMLRLEIKREGDDFLALNPRRNDTHFGSFRIGFRGKHQGVFKDFADDEARGDMLKLIAYCLNIDQWTACRDYAWPLLGWSENDPPAVLPQVRKRMTWDDEGDIKESKWVKRFFFYECVPLVGTPAAAYLAGRQIDLSRLVKIPESIRFCPKCRHSETGCDYPAMVCRFTSSDGKFAALHFTYLAERSGQWKKADISPVKRIVKSPKGCFISIIHGAADVSMGRAPEGSRVFVAEGVETALSVALAMPEERVIAAGSVSNIQNLRLPDAVKSIVFCVDADGQGSASFSSYKKAADLLREKGKSVSVMLPKNGCKDFNDMLQTGFSSVLFNGSERNGEWRQ